MNTTHSVEEIEDELNELKLRIAKMNARRNAQINLLQKNMRERSVPSKIQSTPTDTFRRSYLRYPLHYYWPFLHPYKYSSTNNLLDEKYSIDDLPETSSYFLSKTRRPEVYKFLEQKVQADVLKKLKRFVLDQEKEINGKFLDKLLHQRKIITPALHAEKEFNYDNQSTTKLNSDIQESPFLKPINKNDNFYKRYNSFMKRILKPVRKVSPSFKSNEYKKSNILTTPNTSWEYKRPPSTIKYFPPKINKPLSPITSPLNDLEVSYLQPWQKYSPIHREYFSDYEYTPKSYRVPKDVDSIIRDMEFENRRTYPFMSTYPSSRLTRNRYAINALKYDPYESDSYVRSTLPTWKQYYYTQKLRSKPSNERFVDYYDPYRDFFCDAASVKSDELITSPSKDLDVDSIISDTYSISPLSKSHESFDDTQIIDDYRDSIYDEIIKNLRNQQKRKFPRNRRFLSRSFTPGMLKNSYNYRPTQLNSSANYSWKTPSSNVYSSNYENKSNFADDKFKLPKYDSLKTSTTDNRFSTSNYEPSSLTQDRTNSQELKDTQENVFSKQPSDNVSSVAFNQAHRPSVLSSRDNNCTLQKNADASFIVPPNNDIKNQISTDDNVSMKYNTLNYRSASIEKDNNNDTLLTSSGVDKMESPVKENINVNAFEKESEFITNPTRRNSIFENKQLIDQPGSTKQLQSSPKKQSNVGNPAAPVNQFAEANSAISMPMSRKNSIQYPIRKESIHTGSIEEEPNIYSPTEKNRKYSKDQFSHPSETIPKNINTSSNLDKRLSYGGNVRASFDEGKEDTIKSEADTYPSYEASDNVFQPDYSENYINRKPYNEDYNKPNQYQTQNFENMGITNEPDATSLKCQEKPTYETTSHQSNYNRYPEITDQHPQNPNERYYINQYDSNANNDAYKQYDDYTYPDRKNEYKDQYNYHAPYDADVSYKGGAFEADPPRAENRAQYHDSNYTTEKRPSNESYHAANLPRATEYEKYQYEMYPDEDYNTRRTNRGSLHQSDNYVHDSKFGETSLDDTYGDDYRLQNLQTTRYRKDSKPGPLEGYNNDNQYIEAEQKFSENYPTSAAVERDSNNPTFSHNERNKSEYRDDENNGEQTTEVVQENRAENARPSNVDQKARERKKSAAVESQQEPDTTLSESQPKEVSISRRTSKASITLAEQRKAAALADKNKNLKGKPVESKFKRTPSMLKTKPIVKKT